MEEKSAKGRLEILLSESEESAARRAQTAFDELASPFQRRLVLFGAGGFGKRTLAGLRKVGVEPLAFADNNASLWGRDVLGVPVFSPREAAARFGQDSAFLVTIWTGRGTELMGDHIAFLKKLGCRIAIPAAAVYWKHPDVFLPYYPLDLPQKVLAERDQVRAAFELWSDDASRAEYVAQVTFRLHLDYAAMGPADRGDHYFPKDVFERMSNEVFVDCGAFDGDTIQLLVRLGNFSKILTFEPDPLNWEKLRKNLQALPPGVQARISASQRAVSSRSGTVQFESTGTDLSTMGRGTLSVDCVTLDEVLENERPTFLKFDIEGAELDALAGAPRTIARHAPVLAVSSYHLQNHLWKIPLAVRAMRDDYRYFLRAHGTEAWELVCYAVPPGRLASAAGAGEGER